MSLTVPKERPPDADIPVPKHRPIVGLFAWALSWEVYLILLVAGFLRLYQLGTSEFDGDQAAIFGAAREALQHWLWPAVSNRASIGIENPPAVIYLLMLPAALSTDPLWATVMVGVFNTIAVLLTYFFTRRYYGRLAGIIAALLYATAAKPLNYSRIIWQQNMLAPFIVLFLFALFWGVVERRKGWLFPALFLLGVCYQLHETAAVLFIPLLIAVVLAPGTMRWRDLGLGMVSLLVIFSTYILWLISSKFADLSILLQLVKLHAHIDFTAINYYKYFISPYGYFSYDQPPTSPAAILGLFTPLLFWLRYAVLLLVVGGLAIAGVLALWSRRAASPGAAMHAATNEAIQRVEKAGSKGATGQRKQAQWLVQLQRWWKELRASPDRCGLLLLFVWQVVPLLILSRHSLDIFPYYLLMLMPGPFILIGIFVARVIAWSQRRGVYWSVLRYATYALAAFAMIGQLVTCTATLIDGVNGSNGHGKTFSTLSALQHAFSEADQVAQAYHLNRVYITTDVFSQTATQYLVQQMRTPTTLFDDTRCLVLPNVADGPAVLLVSPYADVTLALLQQFAIVQLIDQPARLGAPPYKLYIVTPSTRQSSAQSSFVQNLQLLDVQRGQMDVENSAWFVSRWNLLPAAQASTRTTYNYAMTMLGAGSNAFSSHSLCSFTAIRPDDQLLVAFTLPKNVTVPTLVTVAGKSYTTTPYNPWFGPFHLQTDRTQDSPSATLQTAEGVDRISVSVSQ